MDDVGKCQPDMGTIDCLMSIFQYSGFCSHLLQVVRRTTVATSWTSLPLRVVSGPWAWSLLISYLFAVVRHDHALTL
jgi:hypothetical protein